MYDGYSNRPTYNSVFSKVQLLISDIGLQIRPQASLIGEAGLYWESRYLKYDIYQKFDFGVCSLCVKGFEH